MNQLGQIFRFGSVGALAAVMHYGVAVIVIFAEAGILVANAVGFMCAFVVGFVGHRYFTFRNSGGRRWRSLLRYGTVSMPGFLAGQFLLDTIVDLHWLPDLVALGVVMTAVAASNFVFSKNWAFADPVTR